MHEWKGENKKFCYKMRNVNVNIEYTKVIKLLKVLLSYKEGH